MKILDKYGRIFSIGVEKMVPTYNKELCNYIISKQQKDLLVIFEKFSDKITDPEDNIFFLQNEILDKMLINIEESKKKRITLDELFKGIDKEDKRRIASLDIEKKLQHNTHHCKIIGVEYFDEDRFMNILNKRMQTILTKYNLNSNDDYNKIYKFLSSLKLILQSSDDSLNALSNQYLFFEQHYKVEDSEEVISVYGIKHYKIDILKEIITDYNEVDITNKSKLTNAFR